MRAQSVALFLLLAAPVWADEVLPPQTGSGTGDMLQSNYDPGTNNAVDYCEALSPDTGVNPVIDYDALLDFVQMDPGRDGNALKNLVVGETVFQVRFTSGDLAFNCTDGAQCFLDLPWIFLADIEMRDELRFHDIASPVPTNDGACDWDSDDDEFVCGDGTGQVRIRQTDTHSYCPTIYIQGGAVAGTDDIASIWRAPAGATITEVWCETNAGTVTFNYENDDGTTADVMSADLVCDTTGEVDSSPAGDTTFDAGHTLDLKVVSVSTPGARLSTCFNYTFDEGT